MGQLKEIEIPLWKPQIRFKKAKTWLKAFCGGIGSGKTFIGAIDLIERIEPGRTYMVAAPTYRSMKDTTWKSFLEAAALLNVEFTTNASNWVVSMKGAEIAWRTAEKPDRWRSMNLSGIWLDEPSYMKEEVFNVGVGRLREKGAAGWMNLTFTPKGKANWTYKLTEKYAKEIAKDLYYKEENKCVLVKARTRENPFLDPGYFARLKSIYPTQIQQQELDAISLDGYGKLFNREWFKTVKALPSDARRVRYWDKAGTEDGGAYTAGVRMSMTPDKKFYVEHVVRGQWSPAGRNQVIKTTTDADHALFGKKIKVMIEQEPGSGGKMDALYTVSDLAGHNIHAELPVGNKFTRASPMAAQAEVGNVFLVEGEWNEPYLDEMEAFDLDAKFKDQVDASSGAFNELALTKPRTIGFH